MPIILALETSTEVASVALLHDQALLTRQTVGVQTHSQTVLPMMSELLSEAGLSLRQCDAIAFGCGPGSFTGVRTACGITQGMAMGANLPVIPVVTLLAMAEACRERTGATDVLSLLDARMNELYWAQYQFDGVQWQTTTPPQLSGAAGVQAQGRPTVCGSGLEAAHGSMPGQIAQLSQVSGIQPHAAQVARLALRAFAAGETVPPSQASPLYLRNKVALTMEERNQRAAAAAAGAVS